MRKNDALTRRWWALRIWWVLRDWVSPVPVPTLVLSSVLKYLNTIFLYFKFFFWIFSSLLHHHTLTIRHLQMNTKHKNKLGSSVALNVTMTKQQMPLIASLIHCCVCSTPTTHASAAQHFKRECKWCHACPHLQGGATELAAKCVF